MLDIRFITNNLETVKLNLKNRNYKNLDDIDRLLELYEKTKELKNIADTLKNERNTLSKKIGMLKAQGQDVSDILSKVQSLPAQIKELDEQINNLEYDVNNILLTLPNMLDETVPFGENDTQNVIVKVVGEKPKFEFEPKPHWDLGAELDILDFERAAKITGSRFVLLKNEGAQLERALINFMLDVHTAENGYKEVMPPFIVNANSLTGTGQLPKFEEDLFKLVNTNYYLAPTAEVPVTNIFRNEILDADDLPISYAAYTPCFRAEAGSWGKDTRGIIRQHQFNKIELVKFVKPEDSKIEHEKLLSDAESILQKLGLHYRVVLLCSGDTGFASSKTYDIEVWLPSQNTYREISSCSNFTDFQARRANIKFRRTPKEKPEYIHTINGSGLAIGRTLAAILENYQTANGSIKIPDALIKYTKFSEIS